MTIAKAVELLMKFVDINYEQCVKTDEDIKILENKFEEFLKSKHKNKLEVSYKLNIAFSKNFLIRNDNELDFGNYLQTTEIYADYILKNENNRSKFIYGLVGSAITVIGGLIGALITAFV